LKQNKTVYLMSDCGLPAFCDPGQKLVDACHHQNVKVTSTPFPNSIALAMALSGFPHGSFYFGGFIPLKDPERTDWLKTQLKRTEPVIMMDTPYRLKKLVEELVALKAQKEVFLGLDLGSPSESLLRGPVTKINTRSEIQEKREFILILGPL
jgi:16S rRNA (cytidine1402-2'-O)-methyltransferase